MRKKLNLFIVLLFICHVTFAQTKSYFQQETNYKINVLLNDINHTLNASMELEYINRSSDTLSFIWMHLWPNAYKDRSTALSKQQLNNKNTALYFAKDNERGYIDSLKFTVDGTLANWSYDPENIDICKLTLPKPLYPGQRTFIKTPFFVKLPSARFSRLGHTGQAYAITQWYPKPAVYDNKGWHPIPYLDQGEFYSEYGTFEVTITLPKNYVVGATGDLINSENEVKWMNEKAVETSKLNILPIKPKQKVDLSFPPSEKEVKTLTFKQSKVHDFAWFADKRFHVLKGEVILPESNRKVTTWSLFTNNEAYLWMNSLSYTNDAIKYYSNWIGDYPYNQCTVVDGTIAAGGGMEYPNVTIIGSSGDSLTLETTIVHEVGHNWFYGIFGSNEREHPWMDEGINTFYQLRYCKTKYPVSKYGNINDLSSGLGFLAKISGIDKLNFQQLLNFEYLISASNNSDQPIEGNGPDFKMLNYGTIVYSKTALVFNYLKEFMGESAFDFAMKNYFKEWSFKHPYPEDLKKVFESSNGNDYNWFFNDLINTNKKQDAAIQYVKRKDNFLNINIKQKGDLWLPFKVSLLKDSSVVYNQWITPTSKDTQLVLLNSNNQINLISIDEGFINPDVNTKNNFSSTQGLFKKGSPFKFKFIGKVELPDKNKINWFPVVGWNQYNNWMAGLAFYNKLIPFKKFEYAIVPMYSFGDNSLSGIGNINYSIHTHNLQLPTIDAGVNVRRFSYNRLNYKNEEGTTSTSNLYYNRFEPYIAFNLKPTILNKPIKSQITLSAIVLFNDDLSYQTRGRFGKIINEQNEFYRINYSFINKRILDPYGINLCFENSTNYSRISSTINYRISYEKGRKGLDIRLFAGYLFNENAIKDGVGFNLSDRSSTRGSSDYAFDELYFARSEGVDFLGKQIAMRDGFFKAFTPIANNRQWVVALNLSAGLPGNLPLKVFTDIGTTKDLTTDLKNIYNISSTFIGDAGFSVSLAKDAIEIFFPIVKSEAINKYFDLNNIKFGDQIRFIFDLKKLNPLNIRNSFY